MSRLTDNDRHWGPFTLGPWHRTFSVSLNTAGNEDKDDHNNLWFIGFGRIMQLRLPRIIAPLKIKQIAQSWDEETIKRMGRNWYYDVHERCFGFSLSDMGNGYDFLQVFFGARTHSSDTDMTWCKHLPWKQWRCVRHSIYNPDGSHFATEDRKAGWNAFFEKREQCPAVHFGFEDYDGELITATCRIEEREWHKGDGWFRWLKYFSTPKIRRDLDLRFNAEVGPQKGSWKGGTTGHGIEMLTGETPERAFRRYCEKDHERKGKKFKLRFIGPCSAPSKALQPA